MRRTSCRPPCSARSSKASRAAGDLLHRDRVRRRGGARSRARAALAQLLVGAPSVPLAADYTVQGLARSFGMALDRLVRHEGTRAQAAAFAATTPSPSAAPAAARWEATGTIRVPVSSGQSDDDTAPPASARASTRTASIVTSPPRQRPRIHPRTARTPRHMGWRAELRRRWRDRSSGVRRRLRRRFRRRGRRAGGRRARRAARRRLRHFVRDEADLAPQGSSDAMDAAPANGAPANGPPALAPTVARSNRPPRRSSDRCSRASRRRSTVIRCTRWRVARTRVSASVSARSINARGARRRRVADEGGRRRCVRAFLRRRRRPARGGDQREQSSGTPGRRRRKAARRSVVDATLCCGGAHPPFVRAENEALVTSVLAPLWPVAAGLGLTSARAIAVLLVLGIHMGAQEAPRGSRSASLRTHRGASRKGAGGDRCAGPGLVQRQVGLAPSGRIDPETKRRSPPRCGASVRPRPFPS